MSGAAALSILAIPGALRAGSMNRALARAAVRVAGDDVTVTVHELGGIPLFDADVEAAGMPERVAALREAIAASDAVLLCTPEYNSSIPGVLKNAIDWASRGGRESPLNGALAGMVGASPGGFGTIRSQTHLRQVLQFIGVRVMVKPELYFSRAKGLFGEDGELEDADAAEQLRGHVAALAGWAREVRG